MPQQSSERLREKIESVNLIYRRMLLRQYEEYIASLKKDLVDLREARVVVSNASDESKRLDADIERLINNLKAAEEKLAALKAEAGEERAQAKLQQEITTSSECDKILNYTRPSDKPRAGNFPGDIPPPGAIWCGKVGVDTGLNANDPKLLVQALVERAAPILWFSPDEPLLQPDSKHINIPMTLPGDNKSKHPLVYYRISRIIDDKIKAGKNEETHKINECTPEIESATEGNRRFNICTTELALKTLDEVTVRYYLYYPKDMGFKEHANDLESLRLDIGFTPLNADGKKLAEGDAAKYYVAHIKTAVGAAHGVSWYGNQLDIGENERDVSLPLTVLVEEGKHATSPDRNADGFYSPGYDVNRRYNDAWGVRDLIGSGQLGGARYQSSMTKPRRPEVGLLFPQVRGQANREELLKHYRGSHKNEVLNAPPYELKRVYPKLKGIVETAEKEREGQLKEKYKNQLPLLQRRAVKKEMGLSLASVMNRENFDRDEPRKATGHGFFEKAIKKGLGFERGEEAVDALTFAYRHDGQHGFTISPPTGRPFLSALGGYLMPKLNFAPSGPERHWSIEGLFTPSASRTFDWYVSAGPEWFRPVGEGGYDTRFATEGGLKFRFRYKLFIGGRIGIRTTSIRQPRDPRLIIEFGPGAF